MISGNQSEELSNLVGLGLSFYWLQADQFRQIWVDKT
jgi:hypothetical protein